MRLIIEQRCDDAGGQQDSNNRDLVGQTHARGVTGRHLTLRSNARRYCFTRNSTPWVGQYLMLGSVYCALGYSSPPTGQNLVATVAAGMAAGAVAAGGNCCC